MNRFQKLAIAATVVTIVQVALGALVRATKSGLGCGHDWPRCNGRLLPAIENRAVLIEYSHRIAASLVMILVFALAVVAWLSYRRVKTMFWPSLAALILVLAQGGIGAAVVFGGLEAATVVLHFVVAATFLGLLTFTATNSMLRRGGGSDSVTKMAAASAVSVFVVLVIGSFVSQFDAALAFPDWPLMNGSLSPPQEGGERIVHYVHRIAAGLLGAVLIAFAVAATRRSPKDRLTVTFAHASVALWAAQVALGALNVFTRSATWTVVLHVLTAVLLWAAAVAAWVAAYHANGSGEDPVHGDEDAPSLVRTAGARAGAYFMLTKPRIIELLLITTVPSMIIAARGWPSTWLVVATLIGGSLTAGSANAINCFVDRDIDERMERTSGRPLPRHTVSPRDALVFGIVLGVAGFGWLAVLVNLLSAALALSAILFYVFVYTMWMKRRTPSNIVIGGAAGAVPVLVGWAAVTGRVEMPAWVLFGIIFYWTPPHFWALALRYSDDYAKAGVPMLPVVHGQDETTRQMLLYSVVLGAVSILLVPVADLGALYASAAVLLAGGFIASAYRLRRNPSPRAAMKVFHASLGYLVLLFAAAAADAAMFGGGLQEFHVEIASVGAVLFLGFEAAIVASVVSGYSGARSRPGMFAEVAWTAVPIVIVLALFIVSSRSGAYASKVDGPPVSTVRLQKIEIGSTVPDAPLSTLQGTTIRLSDFKGHGVVVNFWASWCTPCRKEFPRIAEALRSQPQLRAVGVVFSDSPAAARRFERQNNARWPSLADPDGKIAAAFGVTAPPGVPQTFFINAEGVVVARLFGEVTDAQLAENIAKITPTGT